MKTGSMMPGRAIAIVLAVATILSVDGTATAAGKKAAGRAAADPEFKSLIDS
jgi:hypothetical protein